MPYVDLLQEAVPLARRASAQELLTPNETQRTTLIVAGCYVVAIAILW